jgi:hypothetical protein
MEDRSLQFDMAGETKALASRNQVEGSRTKSDNNRFARKGGDETESLNQTERARPTSGIFRKEKLNEEKVYMSLAPYVNFIDRRRPLMIQLVG